MVDIREEIVKTLEDAGILNNLKAQLRMKVVQAMEAHSSHSSLQKVSSPFLESDEGKVCLEIVKDFLEKCNLTSTLQVLLPEAQMMGSSLPQRVLDEKLGFKQEADKSLLVSLLEKSKGGGSRPSLEPAPAAKPASKMTPFTKPKKEEEVKDNSKPKDNIKLAPLMPKTAAKRPNTKAFDIINVEEKHSMSPEIDESIEESIVGGNDDDESKELFESMGGSSMGVDASANSLALESLDYVEKVKPPRR